MSFFKAHLSNFAVDVNYIVVVKMLKISFDNPVKLLTLSHAPKSVMMVKVDSTVYMWTAPYSDTL